MTKTSKMCSLYDRAEVVKLQNCFFPLGFGNWYLYGVKIVPSTN